MNEMWNICERGRARWIFPKREEGAVNQYVDFLHLFENDNAAELRISADTDFSVWLNGRFIGDGQYSNYPDAKTYESFLLADSLRSGRNTIAVTVFYNGRTSSVYRRGEAGLVFEVRAKDGSVLAASGTETLCRTNPCYHSGPIAIVSGQLAYTFGYDARNEDRFQDDGYRPGTEWRRIDSAEATIPEVRCELSSRPVPRLVDGGSVEVKIADAGLFRFEKALAGSSSGAEPREQTAAGLVMSDGKTASPGWQMQNSLMASVQPEKLVGMPKGCCLHTCEGGLHVDVQDLDRNDGVYLLFDMGREEAGHLELEVEAEEGTIVDMGYGEHIDDGRVRAFVGGRSFAGRYICGGGSRPFRHPFLRWAGRYLQMNIYARRFTLRKFSLRRSEYPVELRGELSTGNELHGRILDVGRRTLHLCMHEHYEDTPWREQALYANDARTQALCGYYAFGETAMPRASFALLGRGLREDGYLELTAPAKPGLTIPSFTLVWMLAVRDYYLFSGDDSLARAFLPQILSMLRAFLNERKDGLLPLREQKGIWHFYDWSAGMSGYSKEEFEQGLESDLPLNCYLILALEAALQMLEWCGDGGSDELNSAAGGLRAAVAERFWDSQEGVFLTHKSSKRFTELTQALAVLAGVGDDKMRSAVLERMVRRDSGLAGPGLSQSYYTFEAMMTDKSRFGAEVLRRIEEIWGKMLDAGATSFWETIIGASDFSNAGSLCHGWSAVPVYVLYHDVLGVRPLKPGFRTFAVEPLRVVDACSGHVPVPGGAISVSWRADKTGEARCEIAAPAGCSLSAVQS